MNLPLSWLGLPPKRTSLLPVDSRQSPFANQFDYAILGPIDLGLGPFEEVAFFHKRSQTLLVTDTIVSVPEDPPAIVQLDPYPLLFHAKDRASDRIEDNAANRLKGWQRIALFAFYFRPSVLKTAGLLQSLRDSWNAPDRSRKAFFGWFPFQWQENWQRAFDTLCGGGRPFVAPILQTLILNRAPRATIAWANRVASWNFQRIVPCHFDSPIVADARQFRQAFAFLEKPLSLSERLLRPPSLELPEEDFGLLKELDATLKKRGIVPPPQEKV